MEKAEKRMAKMMHLTSSPRRKLRRSTWITLPPPQIPSLVYASLVGCIAAPNIYTWGQRCRRRQPTLDRNGTTEDLAWVNHGSHYVVPSWNRTRLHVVLPSCNGFRLASARWTSKASRTGYLAFRSPSP
eukprot:2899191-Amphidinium_carterae.1